LTRTFFSLQRPWIPTAISAANLTMTAVAALVLYKPFGVGGIVASTGIATAGSVIAQCAVLRRQLGGLELGRLADSALRIGVGSAALAGVSYAVWLGLDSALGRSLGGQVISLSAGLAAGGAVYLGIERLLRVTELEQIIRLLRRK
jgi:putative peptidoglycan lipid II flippase